MTPMSRVAQEQALVGLYQLVADRFAPEGFLRWDNPGVEDDLPSVELRRDAGNRRREAFSVAGGDMTSHTEIAVNLWVSFPEVESVFDKWWYAVGHRKAPWPPPAPTVTASLAGSMELAGQELGQVLSQFKIFAPSDVRRVSAVVNDGITQFGLPFFAAFPTLRALDREIDWRTPFRRQIGASIPCPHIRMLIVARLLARPDYPEVLDRYTREIRDDKTAHWRDFQMLLPILADVQPVAEAYRPGEPPSPPPRRHRREPLLRWMWKRWVRYRAGQKLRRSIVPYSTYEREIKRREL